MTENSVVKYEGLLSDARVKRWLSSLARGSPITAEVAGRRLRRACELMPTTPGVMVEKAEKSSKGFQDDLEDLVRRLENKGKVPGYVPGILKTVKTGFGNP